MVQRVDYESIPGIRFNEYLSKLRVILGGLSSPGGTDFKSFREQLRKLGIWDRERSMAMFSLLDIAWDRKSVTMGPLARQLAEAPDDESFQKVLFSRLRATNILLVKYVMEALDVEAGGRLHSVHELYRMVTSYVYPGEYITLPAFQAWIEWLAASGHIKLVGIRWALSDLGLAELPELRGMDVEEILEDMAEEAALAAEGGGDEAADGGASEAPPASATTPAAAPVAKAAFDDEEEEEDLFADLPPEPAPPSAAAIAKAEAAMEQRFTPPTPAASAAPALAAPPQAGLSQPVASSGWVTRPAVLAGSADAKKLATRLKNSYALWADWPSWSAESLGVTVPEAGAEDALLLELGVLATLIEGLTPQPQVFAFVKRLRVAGFFGALAGEGGFGAALVALGDLDGEPWTRALSERLMAAHGMARRLGAEPGLLERLGKLTKGAGVVAAVRAELFGDAGTEAPFWVTRELLKLGVFKLKQVHDCVAVPTPRLVRNAWRIGLVPTPEATSFDQLVAVSQAVSALFKGDAGYGEALEVMDRTLGLTGA